MGPASRDILDGRNWIARSHRLQVMNALRSGVLIPLVLTSCDLPSTHPATPDSGIDGIVVAWPTCAVDLSASPCQQNRMQADVPRADQRLDSNWSQRGNRSGRVDRTDPH